MFVVGPLRMYERFFSYIGVWVINLNMIYDSRQIQELLRLEPSLNLNLRIEYQEYQDLTKKTTGHNIVIDYSYGLSQNFV